MAALFENLAFAVLIGGQFGAAITVLSERATLYPDQPIRLNDALSAFVAREEA